MIKQPSNKLEATMEHDSGCAVADGSQRCQVCLNEPELAFRVGLAMGAGLCLFLVSIVLRIMSL